VREGQVIRQAPVATIVVWGALSYASYWYLSAHFADRLENLTAANTALQATVGQLQNELKGASPQLAAMQARRAAARNKLLELYVAVGPLIGKPIPVNLNDKKGMEEAFSSLQQRAALWTNETAAFIEQNLGPAARDRSASATQMGRGPNLEGVADHSGWRFGQSSNRIRSGLPFRLVASSRCSLK